MKKIIINAENPNGIEVDLTAEEISQRKIDNADYETKKQAEKDAKTAKATAQASGNTKLLDLGLTQAEATAMTGFAPSE